MHTKTKKLHTSSTTVRTWPFYGTLALIALYSVLLIAKHAKAETYHKAPPANQITKAEALRLSLNEPDTVIYKCSAVKITKKGTFKNIPASGDNGFWIEPSLEQKKRVQEAK